MKHGSQDLRVAVVQAAPVVMDLHGSVAKAIRLIGEAAENGAQLVVFPETFLPAYPRGLSFGFVVGSRTEEGRRDWQRYHDNSVTVPGEETLLLGEAAREDGVYLSMGVTEKAKNSNTLYCSNLFWGPDGTLLGKHRKLKPTGSERLIWGEGDGSTLTVIDTEFGTMGSLICWENYMPLARTTMYAKGVTIYIAPTADARPEWQCTVRHIALEGRCFVLSCNQYVEKSMYPADLHGATDLADQPEVMCSGGSCVVSPYGRYLAGPVYGREEILYSDLDLGEVVRSRLDFDVVGHYARPDVFELRVREGAEEMQEKRGGPSANHG